MTTPADERPVIDAADAVAALAAVVAESGPGYRDPRAVALAAAVNRAGGYWKLDEETRAATRCRYATRDEHGAPCPACLVGRALAVLGVPPADLAAMDTLALGSMKLVEVPGWSLTVGARRVLDVAQGEQDNADTWGSSLAAAYTSAIRGRMLGPQVPADLHDQVAAALGGAAPGDADADDAADPEDTTTAAVVESDDKACSKEAAEAHA